MNARESEALQSEFSGDYCEFQCMNLRQGPHDIYLFTCSGKSLWNIVQINRKTDDKEAGYQRALSGSRAEKIARFIDAGNSIPASVLVSFDKATFEGGKLVVPNRPDAGWVIDGQHRLEGAHRSKTEIVFPVVAFVGLETADQINLFVTINKEHKGVPASLYYELLKQLPGTKSPAEMAKERAADLATALKQDEESPFSNRIVVTIAPREGELSLTNWVRKVSPLIKQGGRLSNVSDESRIGTFNNFYRGLGQVFPKEFNRRESIFFKTLGFGALVNILPTFLDLTLQHSKAFRVIDVADMFRRVEDFDFSAWHQMGTGNAAEIASGNDLLQSLKDTFSESDAAEIVLK